jgi:hypothetical protein
MFDDLLRNRFRRFTPGSRQRLTVRLWAVCTLAQWAFVAGIAFLMDEWDRIRRPGTLHIVDDGQLLIFAAGIVSAPVMAFLWAHVWTRFRNHLRAIQPAHLCRVCGYNLTGNISGNCPECGVSAGAERS